MAQKTAWDAAALTESDINTYLMGEGGAWTSWTPAVVQSGSVTVTNTRSRYARYGRTIHFSADLAVTGSGTSSNAITISLPVTAAATNTVFGSGLLTDSSASLIYPAVLLAISTTTVQLRDTTTSGGDGRLGFAVFTAGLASGDTIRISGTYEAAS